MCGFFFPCLNIGSTYFLFIRSSGYIDELAWAALWMYLATHESSYLDKAKAFYSQLGNGPPWAFSWDDKKAGVQVGRDLLPQIKCLFIL